MDTSLLCMLRFLFMSRGDWIGFVFERLTATLKMTNIEFLHSENATEMF